MRPSVPVDTEELNELRRTSTELREVVRYLKRERDLLEAKQSVAEGEVRTLYYPYTVLRCTALYSVPLPSVLALYPL